MELQRILAKDSRTAMDQVNNLYGKDALVVSNKRAKGKTELIVAIDLETDSESVLKDLEVQGECQKLDSISDNLNFDQVMESRIFKTTNDSPSESAKTTLLGSSPKSTNRDIDFAAEDRERLKSREIVDLVKQELTAMRHEFKLSQRLEFWSDTHNVPEEVQPLIDALNRTGMPAPLQSLVSDIASQVDISSDIIGTIADSLAESLSHIEILDEMGGVHIFGGSAGSGKTLSMMKVAHQKANEYGAESLAIISFSDYRFGAWSQSQLLASQAGVDIYRANSLEVLDQLLLELDDRRLILIDTSSIRDTSSFNALIEHLPIAQKHLVLAADASEGSATSYLSEPLKKWDSVIITKLENRTFPWSVVSALVNYKVPLSLVSSSSLASEAALSATGAELIKSSLDQLTTSFV
ncbi:hypothetical protein N9W15_07310 [Porticoccaceae bacterium]|nr:hypothetical protein [Porticoccaceae bacterium]